MDLMSEWKTNLVNEKKMAIRIADLVKLINWIHDTDVAQHLNIAESSLIFIISRYLYIMHFLNNFKSQLEMFYIALKFYR